MAWPLSEVEVQAAPDPPGVSRRARRGGLAIVFAAVVFGLSVSVLTGPSHRKSSPPDPEALQALAAYEVVYSGPGGVRVVPVVSGTPLQLITSPAGPPLSASLDVVFVNLGNLYLLPSPFGFGGRTTIQADRLFPMTWPGTVGIETDLGPDGIWADFVDLQGSTPDISAAWRMPSGYHPVSQYLATGPDGAVAAWSPGPDGQAQLGRVIAAHASWVITAGGPVTAWVDGSGCSAAGECPLRVSSNSEVHTVGPPPGHSGFVAGGAISPDGQWLAGFVRVPGRSDQGQLALVNTGTYTTRLVPDGTVSIQRAIPSVEWSPDGAAIFFSGVNGHMHVYRPTSTRALSLDLPGSASFSVTQT